MALKPNAGLRFPHELPPLISVLKLLFPIPKTIVFQIRLYIIHLTICRSVSMTRSLGIIMKYLHYFPSVLHSVYVTNPSQSAELNKGHQTKVFIQSHQLCIISPSPNKLSLTLTAPNIFRYTFL